MSVKITEPDFSVMNKKKSSQMNHAKILSFWGISRVLLENDDFFDDVKTSQNITLSK